MSLTAQVTGGATGTNTYSWTATLNGQTLFSGSASSFAFTPTIDGTYKINLTATDSLGDTASASGSLVVYTSSTLTVSLGGPYAGDPSAAVTLLAAVSGQNLTGLTYSWTFGDGGTQSGSSPLVSYSYAAAGTYTASVTVTNSDGATGTSSAQVTVASTALQPVTLDGASYALAGSSVAFSVSNPNQPPAGGFTYHWSFGDGATDVTGAPVDSHAYTAAGSYTAAVTVTDNKGDQAVSSTAVTISSDSTDPLFTPVVNSSSFSYVGSFRMPTSAGGQDTFIGGPLTYRYVNGNLQFLSATTQGLVYETNYPGVGVSSDPSGLPQAQVVNYWGDVYTGQRWVGNNGGDNAMDGSIGTDGLYYDQSSGRLYWSYDYNYNATNPYNPSLGYSTLNAATGTATGVGAWSLTGRQAKFDQGGVTAIPQWFANRYTGGDTLAVGFGGYFDVDGDASFGPALAAIAPPNPSVNADDSSLANVPLLGYPFGAADHAHRDTDVTDYYENGSYPTTPGMWTPANGTGYWTDSDLIGQGGTWIDTPTMQGVLFIAKVGQGDVWYQDSDRHAQSGAFEWMVYNPADLAAVATGAKQQWQIQPEYEWTTPALPLTDGDVNGFAGGGASMVSGVAFNPTTNQLYVLVNDAWQDPTGVEWYPEVYVFQVEAPAAPTTPGSPQVLTDAQPAFSETGPGWTGSGYGYLGEQGQLNNAAPGAASATWKVSGLAAGWYTLAADWGGLGAGNTGAAVYQIYDGSTLVKTVTVSQQQQPSGQVVGGALFQQLATVDVTSGSLTVVASSMAAGDLGADALWIDPASNPTG